MRLTPEEYYWELGGYDPEIRYYGGLVTIPKRGLDGLGQKSQSKMDDL